MADAWYTAGRAALQGGSVNWVSHQIGVALVSAIAYEFSAAHTVYADLGDGVLGFGYLPDRTNVSGALNAGPISITAADSDQMGHALVFFRETFDEDTSELLFYCDSVLGLPLTPNGTPLSLVLPHDPAVGVANYSTGAFGIWEGLRNAIPPASVGACAGAVSRSMAY